LPLLLDFQAVDLVEGIVFDHLARVGVAEEQVSVGGFTGLPEGRKGGEQSFSGEREVVLVVGQAEAKEQCVIDYF
jgi:hypothetical protein